MSRAKGKEIKSERRIRTVAPAVPVTRDVADVRDDALDILNNVRSEAAQLHWYAHQFVIGKAGITKDGVLIAFGQAMSEIGMGLNFLADRVNTLAEMTADSEAAE